MSNGKKTAGADRVLSLTVRGRDCGTVQEIVPFLAVSPWEYQIRRLPRPFQTATSAGLPSGSV